MVLKFNVTLNKFDLKRFIFYRMNLKSFKVWFLPVFCFCLAFLISVCNLWLDFGFIVWVCVLFLLGVSLSIILKYVKLFKKMLLTSSDLIGKQRNFFVTEREIQILCSKSVFCGRYFFYDLQTFEDIGSHLFLIFHEKIYIIIPTRCVDREQKEKLISALEKAKN